MDVVNVEQAKIAEEAGVRLICSIWFSMFPILAFIVISIWINKIERYLQACAVMALERVPADIRRDGGVSRMSDPKVCANNFDVISQLSKFNWIYIA